MSNKNVAHEELVIESTNTAKAMVMLREAQGVERMSSVNTKGKVLQDWVGVLPWKVQSVLISAQRGPDSHFCPNIKAVTKWVRRTCQQNADPSHSFMANVAMPSLDDIEYELEYCTMHFTFHLLYGLEIIAYKHPEQHVRDQAMYYYKGVVEVLLHFNIETEAQMDARLVDKV